MHFIPILSTLRRHRTAAVLIALEIAFTCAIVCNAIFLIGERLARMDRPSGLAEDEVIGIGITGIGEGADAKAVTVQDLAALRTIPGVKAAAATNMVPFGDMSWNNSVSTIPDDPASPLNAALYVGSSDLLEAFGVRVLSGRDFTADEYIEYEDLRASRARPGTVIITRAVAERLYPGVNPLGQKIYTWGTEPQVVVGVIERLARGGHPRPSEIDYSIVLPVRMSYRVGGTYVLRVDPARRDEALAAIDATLDRVDPRRILLARQPFSEIRERYFRQDRAMAYLLVGVSLALLVITALGIVGLASFWVQQRTRQIGVRRALGATRGDILRYFQTENFILTTVGIVLGMGLAYAINLWLMGKYQIARLPAEFLPIGAVLLWALGQLAVFGPARRASMIPPAIATRSV